MSVEMALHHDISLHRNTLAQLFLIRMLQMFSWRLNIYDPIWTIHMKYSQVQLPLSGRQDITLGLYLRYSLLSVSSVLSVYLCAIASS